ncbi:MAG: hypothetical protein V1873_03405 [Verrucomicrobiota bacterium]
MQEGQSDKPRIYGPILAVFLLGWAFFAYGHFFQRYYSEPLSFWKGLLLVSSPVAVLVLAAFLWLRRRWWLPSIEQSLQRHTDVIDRIPDSQVGLWIALASGLCLYAEMMIIRLHASYFQVFA